ncbi:formimidoylglutamase [Flavobacterium aurantiibacter]|uniref:Arginase n=1 Tax=Flavobacterium aurantiibacter TaxID=2023067 RepID=A0A255ZQ00_9FLAO|nr:formimidoylglutamase [Flavobacterium aurantiibacter]OYQ43536.1 arginase [Flavobacterium aurantiibacter]
MEKLKLISATDLAKRTNFRSGEVKFGEKMLTVPKDVSAEHFIANCEAKYVLFGIPEDIGVRANHGRRGAHQTWNVALTAIANIQHNRFCKGSKILALGAIDTDAEMEAAENLDYKVSADRDALKLLVGKIDREVAHLVCTIIKAGKIPIIVGGGHNNAYGNIKGTALAKGKSVNAVNLDAHSDFRILEGRHSGNGFSYAYEDGFLKKYFVFGLHECYTSKAVLDLLKKTDDRVRFNTYDEIKVKRQKNFEQELFQALSFIKTDYFGVEIDLDSLPFVPSSAMTNSGFSIEEARQFVYHFGSHPNASYLHICEGAPELENTGNPQLLGKLIGYLLTDFIKASDRN